MVQKLSVKLEKEIDYVAGNGDVLSSAPSELELDVGGVKILALHGHRFGVNTDLYTLSAYARSVKANVCLYGHTHVPDVTYHYGIWFINPGSTSRPRSAVGATYATLDISPDKIMPDIVELSR